VEKINLVQGSDAWHRCRVGSIGGSSIATAVAGGSGKTRKTLMYRMAAEIATGTKFDSYTNVDMERGVALEPDCRRLYEFIKDVDVEQVGSIRTEAHKHVSPDGLCVDDGMIEIKCPRSSTHVETIDRMQVPAQYRKQIQWSLSITGRQWCDFVSYCPEIEDKPIVIIRMTRDEKLIQALAEGADKFIAEMLEIVKKIKEAT